MRRRETGGFAPRGRVTGVALAVALVALALFMPPTVEAQSAAFTLSSGNSSPTGITYTNNRYYVVDADDSVYAYDSDGNAASTYDFDVGSGLYPTGIVYAAGRLHVLDAQSDRIYEYTSSGTYKENEPLSSLNTHASGITYYNGRLYVVDYADDYVYVCTTSGSRQTSLEFSLDTQNGNPSGIAYGASVFYVTDSTDSRVYAYSTSGTYLGYIAVNASTVHGAFWQSGLKVVIDGSSTDQVKEYPLPGLPTDLTVTAADGQVTASWTAPASGGTLGGYRVRHFNPATGSYGSVTEVSASTTSHTLTGLSNFTSYRIVVRSYYFAWQGTAVSSESATPNPGLCDSGAVDLGTLAVAADSELSNSGELPAAAADLPCVDADTRGSAYFTFVIGTDDAGAVKIGAPQGDSAMRPELLLRSGSGAYSGDPLFQDIRADVEDALAAGLVSAVPTPSSPLHRGRRLRGDRHRRRLLRQGDPPAARTDRPFRLRRPDAHRVESRPPGVRRHPQHHRPAHQN